MLERKIKIGLVDDHELFRDMFGKVVGMNQDFEIVKLFRDSQETVLFLEEGGEVDVLIIDWDLVSQNPKIPESYPQNGLDLGFKILRNFKRTKIILISGLNLEKVGILIRRAFDGGIHGFLLKDCGKDEIHNSIQTVMRGSLYYQGQVMDLMGRHFDMQRESKILDPVYLEEDEKQVLRYIANGKNNEMIAQAMGLSISAIEVRRTRIRDKLFAENLYHAISIAYKRGILSIYDEDY